MWPSVLVLWILRQLILRNTVDLTSIIVTVFVGLFRFPATCSVDWLGWRCLHLPSKFSTCRGPPLLIHSHGRLWSRLSLLHGRLQPGSFNAQIPVLLCHVHTLRHSHSKVNQSVLNTVRIVSPICCATLSAEVPGRSDAVSSTKTSVVVAARNTRADVI